MVVGRDDVCVLDVFGSFDTGWITDGSRLPHNITLNLTALSALI
jgi:hypothetical protein